MENNNSIKKDSDLQVVEEEKNEFQFPKCCFAATCGDCYYNNGGHCRKHGGYVDPDKWACPDYA